jgi:hypothetical protein
MKKRNYFVYYVVILSFVFSSLYSQDFNSLYTLYKQKDYFHFRDQVKDFNNESVKWQRPLLESISDCIFGNFESSGNNILYLINNFSSDVPDSLLAQIYYKKYYNHAFLYEYKDALESAEILSSKYSNYLSPGDKEYLPEDIIMFTALKDIPPQKITKNGDLNLVIKKDIAGLWNLPVSINENNFDFVFDSGAEYSVIVESIAKKLGLKISDTYFKVGTATDKKILSRVTVATTMKIGNIILNNVVFYVMKDEDFTFGPYKIEGVIGSPIMRAFGEFKITKDNNFIVPEVPENKDIKNFAYTNYTPVIQMIYMYDSLNFIFDSGNNDITLYKPFFDKYSNEITEKYKLTKINLGGAGGLIETDGYIIDKLSLKSGNLSAELVNINLLINALTGDQKYFHGNLGQAYIKQFNTLIMNFKNMYIEFQN